MDERRRFERRPTSIRVEMAHSAFGTIVGFTQDISDGGAAVLVENQPIPPVGTVVSVRFKKVVGAINEEPVSMRIVHHHRNMIGLTFAVGIERQA
ncbi:PilZ domain-containing protein [Exilibacterium tricleocarpae]|uniref:PilZ domain-containing protein n=1 Tax=Exilibacterium tricleocarpae TaxID=2591008 RepID=A0A545U811_9GAMM|nr:PilZ domain-containing protein [Exilibacterium tricleocarpae]TQV85620.1 PilZ domain-containing protein [Exilibacterium tricleocarpae]